MNRFMEHEIAQQILAERLRQVRVLLIAATVQEAIEWHERRSELFRLPGLDVSCVGTENLKSLQRIISESEPFHLAVFDEFISLSVISRVLKEVKPGAAIIQKKDSFATVKLDSEGMPEIAPLNLPAISDAGLQVSPVLQILRNASIWC